MGRKLQDVRRDLTPLEEQGKVEGLFNNTENSGRLGGLVEDIRDAIMEYQVRAQNRPSPSKYLPPLRVNPGRQS